MPNPQPDINRGLLNHSIDTPQGNLKVSKGYALSALIGAAGGLTSSFAAYALMRNRNVDALKSMMMSNALKGAAINTVINEMRIRRDERLRHQDQPAFDAVIQENHKPKVPEYIDATRKWTGLVNGSLIGNYAANEAAALDNLDKNAEVNEYNKEMIRKKRDQDATDEAIGEIATGIIAPLTVFSYLATPTHVSKIPPIHAAASRKAGLDGMPMILSDKSRSGTSYIGPEDFIKKVLPGQVTPEQHIVGSRLGAISIDPGDTSPTSIAREVSRGALRQGKSAPVFSKYLDSTPVKMLGALNSSYSFLADGSNRIADTTALAQAATYIPRSIEDMQSLSRAYNAHKNSLKGKMGLQVPYVLARALPGFIPLMGRVYKKIIDKKSDS